MPLNKPLFGQDSKTYGAHCANISEIIAASISQGPVPILNEETAAAAIDLYLTQTNANSSVDDDGEGDELAGDGSEAGRAGTTFEILRPSSHSGLGASQRSAPEVDDDDDDSQKMRAVALEERQRISLLQRVGRKMGVSRRLVQAAIDDNSSAETALDQWTKDESVAMPDEDEFPGDGDDPA